MKRPILILLLLMLSAATLVAETAIISESWVKLRNAPDESAKAVGLLYGNDAYPVLKTEGGWVQVRTAKGQVGWVPAEKLIVDGQPLASSDAGLESLTVATSLQRQGFRADAQAGLREVAEKYPDTVEQYEAIRHLLYYYPVSSLPEPRDGQVHPAGVLALGQLRDIIVICANLTPKPPPERFWQLDYLMAGITPRLGPLSIEPRHSNCP